MTEEHIIYCPVCKGECAELDDGRRCCKECGIFFKLYFYSSIDEFKIPKDVIDEINHYKETKVPRCQKCFKNFEPAIDSITKKKSEYSWKPTCNCSSKGIRLHIG